MRAFLRGKLIALSASKKKLERTHTSSLTTHLKVLEKKEENSPLARLTRGHRDNILINKIRNEKGDITTVPEEIQNTIRSFYMRLYSTKLENRDKMNKFLDRYQVSKLNQDQVNNLKSPISPKEIEAVINVSQPKKAQDQMGLVQSSTRPSKKI